MIKYCKTPNSFHLESGVARMDRMRQGWMNGSFRINCLWQTWIKERLKTREITVTRANRLYTFQSFPQGDEITFSMHYTKK